MLGVSNLAAVVVATGQVAHGPFLQDNRFLDEH